MSWQETLSWPRLVLFLALVFVLITFSEPFIRRAIPKLAPEKAFDKDTQNWCILPAPLAPLDDGLRSSLDTIDQSSLDLQVQRLAAAVSVPTVSYDDNGDIGKDPRYKTFETLHGVLKSLFPLVHERAELEKVNEYGLLYTLKGSSTKLKPVVFTAHQDVVPVPDASKWTNPPFSGFYDGQYLWGRGSVDCKNNLIGLLSTMETLLSQDYKNKRTIIFSFGFDEEVGGVNGAAYLAEYLEKKLGKNSVLMIMDEGGMGTETIGDVTYAYPAIAEKGYIDIVMTLETPGGHSSKPPPHSGIGIMSKLVIGLEEYPLKPFLDKKNPYRGVLECQAKYSSDQYEPWLKDALMENKEDLGERIAEIREGSTRWLMQTSQAVAIIAGGLKDNQLPEVVTTTINYRVLPSDDIDTLLSNTAEMLASIAHNYSISVTGFGRDDARSSAGLLNLTTTNRLPPSPITPTGPDSPIWNLFAGTLIQVYTNTTSPTTNKITERVVPVGNIMAGNTDTVHYWELTKNIYRYSPRRQGTTFNVHTVDERIDMRTHIEGMRIYYELIRNLDQYTHE